MVVAHTTLTVVFKRLAYLYLFLTDLDFPHGIGGPGGYGPPGAPPAPVGHMVPPGAIGGGGGGGAVGGGGGMPPGPPGGPPGPPQLPPGAPGGPGGDPYAGAGAGGAGGGPPGGPGGPGAALQPQFECPARPNFGTVGKRIDLRANHFQIKMPKDYIHHYDVTIQVQRRRETYCMDEWSNRWSCCFLRCNYESL